MTRLTTTTTLLLTLLVLLSASDLARAQEAGAGETEPPRRPRQWNCIGDPTLLPDGDPARGEIPLAGAAEGWNAFHVFKSDTWRLHTLGAGLMRRENGSPQVLVMDEEGRLFVLQEDSGKWAPHLAIADTASMSAWAAGELDPRLDGPEIWAGGRSGNVFRIDPLGRGFVSEQVDALPGVSLSQFALGDWDPRRSGNELVAVTNDGPVFELRPDPERPGRLVHERLGDLGTRCRDVVLLPRRSDRAPRIAALLQTGEVALLTRTETGFDRATLCSEPMSIARLARRPNEGGAPEVIYVARTDGLILRFEEEQGGSWTREPIYAGPSGPRGLAAGRFVADDGVETVAVFGYSKKVQLLERRLNEPWRVTTLYQDFGGGHWLVAAELDGRNDADELVGGGFGFHVFMLAREPGYGLPATVARDPDRGIPAYPIPGRDETETESSASARLAGRRDGDTRPAGLVAGSGSSLLLAERFDGGRIGELPPGFVVAETRGKGTPARWEIAAGRGGRTHLRLVESRNGGATFNLLLGEKRFPADLRVEVLVRAESGREDQGGGPVWRVKDADNYYVARWNPLEKNLRVYKVEDGKRTMFATSYVECDSLAWHRISIGMRGSRGVVGFDGQECLTFEDATFPEGGAIGLWTKADAATSFADLVVTAIDD